MTPSRTPGHSIDPLIANCRDYWLGWGSDERVDGQLSYYRSGLAHAQLNGVLRLRDIDRLEQSLKDAGERLAGMPWRCWVGPDSAPGTAARLADHGAVRLGAMPIMAVRTDEVVPAERPSGLEIETVEGRAALKEWVQAYTPSFGVPPNLLDDVVHNELDRRDAGRVIRFVGRRAGRVVGTSLLYDAHGVAGVYVVTTAEEHRRQGIGTALTAAALEAGRERGLAVGTLQASPSGFPVYERMGFRTVAAYELFQVAA
ncbi:GNAT family N-acetyltransferase [Streptomyces sp. NPDC058583]|uniref:GNAT family N-acetyltransferase n=1 Tax=unclassified Streptomyces TaxID=2593676 RepID=UPI003649FE99